MSKSRNGACQCGAIRFQVPASPLTYYACHCTDCRAQSASAFGLSYLIMPEAFVVLSGSLKSRATTLPSGLVKVARFCPDCGTRIYHALSDVSQLISVKAGTLQGLDELTPVANIWVASSLPWVAQMFNGLPCFDTQPDDETLIALWRDSREI